MRYKNILIFSVLMLWMLSTPFYAESQEVWSLEQCVNYAINHNIQIKQQELNTEYRDNEVFSKKMNVLPSVNSSAYQSFNSGRTVDPYTNEFSEDNTSSFNMEISANMKLFNGFRKYHEIKKSSLDLEASLKELEKAKNDISVNIANAYFNVLYNKELVEISKSRIETTQEQVENTKKLVNAGSLAQGDLLEVESQLANEELQLVNAENSLKMAYLNLKQLLELDTLKKFKIVSPDIGQITKQTMLPDVEQVYIEAKSYLPQVKSAEINLQSAYEDIAIARSGRYPSLNLSVSYGSGYSDARRVVDEVIPADPLPIGYGVNSGGTQIFDVYQYNFDYTYRTRSFKNQIRDNASTSISLGLSIPIFNGWQVNSSVSGAKINYKIAQYQYEDTKKQLRREINQSHADAVAAMKKYFAAVKAFDAMEESFRYTSRKFNVGMVSSLEYNTAKNQLANTESELLQAKYEFVFKKKILDFYRGKPLTLSSN